MTSKLKHSNIPSEYATGFSNQQNYTALTNSNPPGVFVPYLAPGRKGDTQWMERELLLKLAKAHPLSNARLNMLNPFHLKPEDVLSSEYKLKMIIDKVYNDYKELKIKKDFLDSLPESLKPLGEQLYSQQSAIGEGSASVINGIIEQNMLSGQLTESQARQLRRLIERAGTERLQPLNNMQEARLGREIRANLQEIEAQLVSRGISPVMARTLAAEGYDNALERLSTMPNLRLTIPNQISLALDSAMEIHSRMADPDTINAMDNAENESVVATDGYPSSTSQRVFRNMDENIGDDETGHSIAASGTTLPRLFSERESVQRSPADIWNPEDQQLPAPGRQRQLSPVAGPIASTAERPLERFNIRDLVARRSGLRTSEQLESEGFAPGSSEIEVEPGRTVVFGPLTPLELGASVIPRTAGERQATRFITEEGRAARAARRPQAMESAEQAIRVARSGGTARGLTGPSIITPRSWPVPVSAPVSFEAELPRPGPLSGLSRSERRTPRGESRMSSARARQISERELEEYLSQPVQIGAIEAPAIGFRR